MSKPHKTDDIDSWEAVLAPPTPELDHPTMVGMFAYLLEVEGHRAIDPDATNEYGMSAGPNPFCSISSRDRATCPSCVALRVYRHGYGSGGLDDHPTPTR